MRNNNVNEMHKNILQMGDDPMRYLAVSAEQKMKDSAKPFDAKKFCWVPTEKDEADGYVMGEIKSVDGEVYTVEVKGNVRTLKNITY